MQKTAIVVGATGLVGAAVVSHLTAAENIETVVAITRRPVKYTSPKVVNKVVDFERLDDFAELFSGDLLFSCLGTTAKQAGSIEIQRKVDLYYQLKVAELAAEQGVKHYLLVSSSGANPRSSNPYLKMKGELESGVQDLAFERISIFQPSLLLGDRDQGRLGEGIASAILPHLCKLPGLRRYRPIHGDEVAQKMVVVSDQRGGKFERFVLDQVFL